MKENGISKNEQVNEAEVNEALIQIKADVATGAQGVQQDPTPRKEMIDAIVKHDETPRKVTKVKTTKSLQKQSANKKVRTVEEIDND
jgi:hypothetical protein